MRSVLIRLAGPLQSWGTQGRFGIRDTDREPSKSGILGLVGAAMGVARGDAAALSELRALRLAVRVDREGSLTSDYHTVGGGRFRGEPHGIWSIENEKKEKETVLTQRQYLADASFLAALGGDDGALVDRIGAALQRPVWPLFLGRKACPPAEPVFVGVVDRSPEDAVREASLGGAHRSRAPARLRLVLEGGGADARPRQDDPISFDSATRRFALREVRYEFVDRDSLLEGP